MTSQQVSVIIPVFNCEKFVSRAVQSVLDQTCPASEILVVDDGSTDGSVAVLAAFGDRVRLIRQPNRGVASARNAGLRAAHGRFIAFLDADDWWEPSRLAVQLAAIDRFPDAGMVFTDFSVANLNGSPMMSRGIRWKYRAVRDPDRAAWDRMFSDSATLTAPGIPEEWQPVTAYCGDVLQSLFHGNFINTSSVLLRREVVWRVGEFDSTLDTEEDYDYWLKVAADWPLIYVDAPLVAFRRSPGQLTRADQIGRIVSNALKVVEAVAARHPDRLAPGQVRQRLAHLHATLGSIALRDRNTAEARRRLSTSLRLRPRQALAWVLYALACLPACVLNFADRLRARSASGQRRS